ncbi:MAG TPA: hypothetical protein VEQ63_04925, partial [Bryobacteraceae bacterium]|nr:hypothetical protein [Bryobacteraceae bacterium]
MDHEDQFSLPPAAIRKQLSRILESHALAASDRMARFLRFVVEHSLAGRSGELKEYLIGVEVFDRKQSYDPRVDPIVRVEARRLRAKLAEYYQKDGTADDILVELPKGSYVPRFTRRGDAATSVPSSLSGSGKTPEANAQAQPRTIAVLPFGNVSRDPENDYFSDGLTEELIHALTKVPTLRVVAWNSAVRVRGGERDIYGIGQQLGVETVLMGSVRCDGMRIRILAQLVETKTGFYRWSENYDRDVNEMFAIQEEIARSIVAALQGKLSGDVPRRDYNLQAYNEYLKGRFYWNKRTTDGMRRASTHFEKAIQIDPQFALGYAGLADTYVLLSGYGVAHPAESFHKGRTA